MLSKKIRERETGKNQVLTTNNKCISDLIQLEILSENWSGQMNFIANPITNQPTGRPDTTENMN